MVFEISENSKDFLRKCLEVEEKKRFNWKDLFEHSIFKEELNIEIINNNEESKINDKKQIVKKDSKKVLKKVEYMDVKSRKMIQKLQRIIQKRKVSLRKLFMDLDKSGDNKLDVNEFSRLISCLDSNVKSEEIAYIFSKFDVDGDKEITYEEFEKLLVETDYSNYQMYKDPFLEEKVSTILRNLRAIIKKENLNIEEIFNYFDKDKNNSLDLEEFSQMITSIDSTILTKEIDYVFKEFDQDGNQTIELSEFKQALKHERNVKREKAHTVPPKVQSQDSRAEKIVSDLKYIISVNHINIKKVFKNFDTTKQMSLNIKDFTKLIKVIDESVSQEEINYLFMKFDADNSKSISLEEFEEILR